MCVDVVVLFSCQTSHSSPGCTELILFFYRVAVLILLEAIGDINPVIFTVVENIA